MPTMATRMIKHSTPTEIAEKVLAHKDSLALTLIETAALRAFVSHMQGHSYLSIEDRKLAYRLLDLYGGQE